MLLFDSIDEIVVEGKGWAKIKEDLSTTDDALRNLSSKIKGYSQFKILNLLREKLEEEYNYDPSIIIELVGIGSGVVGVKEDIFIEITFELIVSTDKEFGIDLPVINVDMYSKDDIRLELRR